MQKIMIKGTRDGLTLRLDDQCGFDELLQELEEKLSVNGIEDEDPMVRVIVQLGKRYVTEEQEEQITNIIRDKQKLVIDRIESEVITKQEALDWKKNTDLTPIVKTIRSGQVIHVKGDMLLIGDVNPGGQVTATGHIFVLGKLRGIAHSGTEGAEDTVIAASYMQPSQLRISDQVSRSPDYDAEGIYMECGFYDEEEGKIRMDTLQQVIKKRPDLVSFERRMLNG